MLNMVEFDKRYIHYHCRERLNEKGHPNGRKIYTSLFHYDKEANILFLTFAKARLNVDIMDKAKGVEICSTRMSRLIEKVNNGNITIGVSRSDLKLMLHTKIGRTIPYYISRAIRDFKLDENNVMIITESHQNEVIRIIH